MMKVKLYNNQEMESNDNQNTQIRDCSAQLSLKFIDNKDCEGDKVFNIKY